MSNMSDIKEMIDSYVVSRAAIDARLTQMNTQLESAHAALKETLNIKALILPEWLMSYIEIYFEENDSERRYVSLCKLQFKLGLHIEGQQSPTTEIGLVHKEIDSVLQLDISVSTDRGHWLHMKKDIDLALIRLDPYLGGTYLRTEYPQVYEEIQRKLKEQVSKHSHPVYLSRYIENLGDHGMEEEIIDRLSVEQIDEGEVEVGFSLADLSKRQQQVIQLVIEGYSYSKIGEVLGISKNSVSEHVKQIRRKCKHRTCFQYGFSFSEGVVV